MVLAVRSRTFHSLPFQIQPGRWPFTLGDLFQHQNKLKKFHFHTLFQPVPLYFLKVSICSLMSTNSSLYTESNFIFPCFSVLLTEVHCWLFFLLPYFNNVFETFSTIFCLSVSVPDTIHTFELMTLQPSWGNTSLSYFAWLAQLVPLLS